jgi:hypothetical protein
MGLLYLFLPILTPRVFAFYLRDVCQFDGNFCVKIIVSRKRINTLVFVMELQPVLCEVRGDCLNAARIMFYDACYQDVHVLAFPVGIYSMEFVVKM